MNGLIESLVPSSIITVIETMILAFIIIFTALDIYVGFVLKALAKKTNTPKAWMGFIPITNVYLMAKIAGLSGWYTTSLGLALIPYVGGPITIATFAYIWINIAKKTGRPGWWGIMILVPIINLILIGIMAWGKEPTREEQPISEQTIERQNNPEQNIQEQTYQNNQYQNDEENIKL